jgi:hypothetical protein
VKRKEGERALSLSLSPRERGEREREREEGEGGREGISPVFFIGSAAHTRADEN